MPASPTSSNPTRSLTTACLAWISIVACGAPERTADRPAPRPRALAAAPLVVATEPAPEGSVLRVFVEPDRVVGWIGGSRPHAGQRATLELPDRVLHARIGDDETFELAVAVTEPTAATVRAGDLAQRVTLAPPPAVQPTAYLIADRSAYRPGQTLAFAGFLRAPRRDGTFAPVANAKVEARLVAKARQLVVAKLPLASDARGRIAGTYTFSPSDPLGDYVLSIPDHAGTAEVTLAEFRKSKIKLEVDASIVPRRAELTFRAVDFLDKPIPGGTVSFTAQIVREPAAGDEAAAAFAYGGPGPVLARDDRMQIAADPRSASVRAAARVVIDQREGEVALDRDGAGSFTLPLTAELLRGDHRLLVDAVIVDAIGREQRTTRSIALARPEPEVVLESPGELIAAGTPFELAVRVVDADGRPVAPASASVAAVRISPASSTVISSIPYGYGNGYNGRWNGIWQLSPNGALVSPSRSWPIARRGADTLVATVAVSGGVARLVLDDPGAYRLLASAQLADGSQVWAEQAIAVRDRDRAPALTLALDRRDVRAGEPITARVRARYRGAPVLVVLRDARGIRARHRVVATAGEVRVELATRGAGHGVAVEAYLMGEDGVVHAAQELARIDPASRALAITTSAKPSYGPGELVDLAIAVDRREPVDLVVSVHDQSLLGVAPDRTADPTSFYHADARLHARAGLHVMRAQLGDLTVDEVIARARERVARDPDGLATAEARGVLAMIDKHHQVAISALVRLAGIPVASVRYEPFRVLDAATRRARLVDLFAPAPGLAIQRVADALVVFDGTRTTAATTLDHSYAASGNASFSAPVVVERAALDLTDGSTDVVRRDFSDSAFWDAALVTDATGHARVRFRLPDSLTNWRVVVTAVARDGSAGRHVTSLRTTRDVMIWPILPRQFTEGDSVYISGSVHNLTGAAREIVATLHADHLELRSPATVTVRVAPGTSVPVTWHVRARTAGLATLRMTATSGGIRDASEKRIPIAAPAAEEVVTASGFADRPLAIALPAGVDPATARLELTFAPSIAADLVGTLDYLVEYPYGCAEQTMSRFAPAIRVAGILDHLGIEDGALARRLPGVVDAGLKRLAELQRPDGGWGWQGTATTHEMITPYVVWGLLEAERAGYRLADPRVLRRGLDRVRTLYEAVPRTQRSERTYLAYVYARRGRLPERWWRELAADADQLSDYALALALELAVGRGDAAAADRMAALLRARARRGARGASWQTAGFARWGDDPFETTAVVLKALVAHDVDDPLIPDVVSYFMTTKRGDRWNSTKDTAMILYALTELLARRGARHGGAAVVDYAIDGGPATRVALPAHEARTVVIAGSRLSRTTTIRFAHASPGVMARAVVRFRKTGRDLRPVDGGLAVTRRVYLLGPGGTRERELAPGDRVPRGAYVESEVTVRHAQGQAMRFLLVEDPKPTGAEALPADDKRFPIPRRGWVLREDRRAHLAFHFEQATPVTVTRSVLRLELAGDLVIPPARAELMYETEVRGHAGTFALRVD